MARARVLCGWSPGESLSDLSFLYPPAAGRHLPYNLALPGDLRVGSRGAHRGDGALGRPVDAGERELVERGQRPRLRLGERLDQPRLRQPAAPAQVDRLEVLCPYAELL